jgi:4-amino-4-deoxy-L-arabinose transferase-like glycosyltransferase
MHFAQGFASRRRRHRQALLGVCVLALLWVQWIGLWHGIAHEPNEAGVAQVRLVGGDRPDGFEPFGHHDGAQCRLFDHLAVGHSAPPVFWALVVPSAAQPGVQATPVACPPALEAAAPFLARAPPAPAGNA